MGDSEIIGVLLAGGRGRRMGDIDKCLLPLGERTLVHHAIQRAAPQVQQLLLNIHGEVNRFADYPLTLVQDVVQGHLGPLIGIYSAMGWILEHRPQCHWLASFSTDTPFFPLDWVERLHQAILAEQSLLGSVKSDHQTHPVFSLWSLSLYDELRTFLLRENQRKMLDFFSRHQVSWVEFSTQPIDPFFNINTHEDLEKAEKLCQVW